MQRCHRSHVAGTRSSRAFKAAVVCFWMRLEGKLGYVVQAQRCKRCYNQAKSLVSSGHVVDAPLAFMSGEKGERGEWRGIIMFKTEILYKTAAFCKLGLYSRFKMNSKFSFSLCPITAPQCTPTAEWRQRKHVAVHRSTNLSREPTAFHIITAAGTIPS
jgi:hypothetical protein